MNDNEEQNVMPSHAPPQFLIRNPALGTDDEPVFVQCGENSEETSKTIKSIALANKGKFVDVYQLVGCIREAE